VVADVAAQREVMAPSCIVQLVSYVIL
jgi:hypothetical protein